MNYKERHDWLKEKYPLTVIMDRYNGTYSGAKFLAFPIGFDEVPIEVGGSDTECAYFWKNCEEPVGKGATAQEAIDDLVEQMKESEDERIRKDLIGFIEDIINHGIKEAVAKHNYGDGKQWLAYLEKKKDLMPPTHVDPRDASWEAYYQRGLNKGYELGLEAGRQEQKPEGGCAGPRGRRGGVPKDIMMKAEAFLDRMRPPYDPDDICTAYETGAMEQRPEWSEEDEKRRKNVLRLITEANDRYMIEQSRSPFSAEILWLKSLRPQPKQEWKHYIWAYNLQFNEDALVIYEDNGECELVRKGNRPRRNVSGTYVLIKDVYPQPHWKPSDEQMEVLNEAVETFAGYNDYPAIQSLYNDLKKLMEE